MRKRLTSLLLAGLLVCTSLYGCGSSEEESGTAAPAEETETEAKTDAEAADKPYDGTTLTVLGFSAAVCTAIQDKLTDFYDQTGITVEFEQLSNDELNKKLAVTMAAGGSDVDVFYCQPTVSIGQYTANGWVEPLDGYLDDEVDIDDFMEVSIQQSSVDGQLYGIPVFNEHYVLYYNKAMFEAAGITKIPETYDELIETAAALTDPDNNVYGISMRGDGYGSVPTWISVARSYGADYFDENGTCTVNSEESIEAIEVYKKLLSYSPPGYLSKGWDGTSDDFAQGLAAMRIDCDTQYVYATNPDSSVVYDSVGFAPLPKGSVKASSIESGWSICMSAGSENKGAAWEFIKWATGKETDVYAATQGNFSARTSTWNDAAVLDTYPEDLAAAVLSSSAPEVSDGSSLPDMTHASEARTLLGEVFSLAWQGEEYRTQLDEVTVELQALYDEDMQE